MNSCIHKNVYTELIRKQSKRRQIARKRRKRRWRK